MGSPEDRPRRAANPPHRRLREHKRRRRYVTQHRLTKRHCIARTNFRSHLEKKEKNGYNKLVVRLFRCAEWCFTRTGLRGVGAPRSLPHFMFPRSFYIKSVGIAIPNSKVYASFVVIQTSARAVKTVRAHFFVFTAPPARQARARRRRRTASASRRAARGTPSRPSARPAGRSA